MKMLISLQNLQVSIHGRPLLSELSLNIHAGDKWAILGRNGSGKTTLLNTLCNLHTDYEGRIHLLGQPLQDYPPRELACQIGYLMQSLPGDFPQTVYQFCSTGLHPHLHPLQTISEKHHQKILRCLQMVDLESMAERHLNNLSGGEKRRAEIANLLVQRPRIWLLDEPVNHLDIAHQIHLLETIMNQACLMDGAVISVLHDANLAQRFCTHALLIYPDGSHESGTTAEMLEEKRLSRLFGYPLRRFSDGNRQAFLPA